MTLDFFFNILTAEDRFPRTPEFVVLKDFADAVTKYLNGDGSCEVKRGFVVEDRMEYHISLQYIYDPNIPNAYEVEPLLKVYVSADLLGTSTIEYIGFSMAGQHCNGPDALKEALAKFISMPEVKSRIISFRNRLMEPDIQPEMY